MTPMDIFDSMLESIQQFPLDCNRFERNIKRLNRDHFKYCSALNKLISKLLPAKSEKIDKIQKKIKKTIKRKLKVLEEFETNVLKQQQKLDELVKISDIDTSKFNFQPVAEKSPAIIKMGSIPHGTLKYCICNERAFGNMICCDNPVCSVKWYHFKCANVTTIPKAGWKCSKCLTIKQ